MKALEGFELVDVRADGIDDAVLKRAYQQFGQALLNTRSTTWRGLSESERASEPLALLKAHPALMKRPLIAAEGALFLGWTADVQAQLLG